MKLRWRVVLALAGLVIALASVALMTYVFWRLPVVKEQFRPSPTLFAPPQSLAVGDPWS